MKKVLALCALIALVPGYSQAKNLGGGFVGGSPAEVIQISEIEKLPDDAYVVLQGNITAKTGHEKYTFQDKSGSIQIEIDDDDWNGLTVRPGDVVVIEGEVDKSWSKPTEIEVDVVRMAE